MKASGRPEIKLKDMSVDMVLLYDVLHYYYFPYLDDRRSLLGEVYRVLKPSGLLSIYPTHLQSHMYPNLADIKREIEDARFQLESEIYGILIHDNTLEKGRVMNFRKI